MRGWVIAPMSVALSVLLFGVFALLAQQAVPAYLPVITGLDVAEM